MWMDVDKNGPPENLRSEGQSIYFKHVRYYTLTEKFASRNHILTFRQQGPPKTVAKRLKRTGH